MDTLEFQNKIKTVKKAQLALSHSSLCDRNEALSKIKASLYENREYIFGENKKDIENAKESVSPQIIKRLKFDEAKLSSVLSGIDDIKNLPDPIGKILEKRDLDDFFILSRISVPIGVIAMIFEARPDALVQIVALCIKSGNAIILKGGREAALSNRALFKVITDALENTKLGSEYLMLLESREDVSEILKMDKYIDLVIPRGSNAFVRYVMDNTKIAVLGHADGLCTIYVDESADQQMALKILLDAKTQYTAACNAVETILVNRKIAKAFLPRLKALFESANVTIHGSEEVRKIIDCTLATADDFDREYLSLDVAIKCVSDVEEAIEHINTHGSHHTDAIITKSEENKMLFFSLVDSADVFANCSTRFADGYRYGLGAEVGISTSKIHARGPVGLSGLTSYKWVLEGNGETVGEYSNGEKSFHHRDLI